MEAGGLVGLESQELRDSQCTIDQIFQVTVYSIEQVHTCEQAPLQRRCCTVWIVHML